jgi:glyoxylase-like metal-dependent hydrolase (beta-lactamase superfamily II)
MEGINRMDFIKIFNDHYYFHGAVNIGYVRQAEKGLLIDAGLDTQTMKKVIKKLDELQMPLTHLFITHAHADHYGGAAFLQTKKHVYTIAPYLEEAILRNPVLEPLYLFQGNKPITELRNKFLEGEAIHIDEIVKEGYGEIDGFQLQFIAIPGHSKYQLGVKINELLYAADSYFCLESLRKYKIPYIIDLDDTLASLENIKTITCIGAVPGHGEYEENYLRTIEENINYHLVILQSMREIVKEYDEGLSHEELVRKMCLRWDIKLPTISSWVLFRTAITAYATKLYKDGEVSFIIKHHSLWIQLHTKGEA